LEISTLPSAGMILAAAAYRSARTPLEPEPGCHAQYPGIWVALELGGLGLRCLQSAGIGQAGLMMPVGDSKPTTIGERRADYLAKKGGRDIGILIEHDTVEC
jgi:hypothetical protein